MGILKRFLLVGCLVALSAPGTAAELMKEDFKGETVAQLVKLCSADEESEAGKYAIGFCYGYMTGARQFYRALIDNPETGFKPVACPDGPVPRSEGRMVFLKWAQSNGNNAEMEALEGLIRAAQAEWPCDK